MNDSRSTGKTVILNAAKDLFQDFSLRVKRQVLLFDKLSPIRYNGFTQQISFCSLLPY